MIIRKTKYLQPYMLEDKKRKIKIFSFYENNLQFLYHK